MMTNVPGMRTRLIRLLFLYWLQLCFLWFSSWLFCFRDECFFIGYNCQLLEFLLELKFVIKRDNITVVFW